MDVETKEDQQQRRLGNKDKETNKDRTNADVKGRENKQNKGKSSFKRSRILHGERPANQPLDM